MAQNFLLEIGLEEMPAHVVSPSVVQLKDKTAAFLKDNRLDFESIETFSTPRRLGVRVNGLAEKQADIEEEAKGPAKKIALDDEGNWSKAAQDLPSLLQLHWQDFLDHQSDFSHY